MDRASGPAALVSHRTQARHDRAFRGQLPDETVVLLLRPWWLTAALHAWPVAFGIVALVMLFAGQISSGTHDPAWSVAQAIVGIITLVLLARWAITDGLTWWLTLYIVTDRRVIAGSGAIERKITEIPLQAVQEVFVESLRPIEWLSGIGRVTVFSAGRSSHLTFHNVRHPRQVMESVMQAQQRHVASIPSAPVIADPAIRQVLDTLAQPSPLPDPEPLDPAVSPRWPLSRATYIPLDEGEKLLGVVSRHWWALAEREARPLATLGVAMTVFVAGAWLHLSMRPLGLAVLAVGLIWAFVSYLDFADDVYLITTQRVIDIERRYFIVSQSSLAIENDKIQEAKVKIPSLLARALGFGSVIVTVAGGKPLIMDIVPRPEEIAQGIERNRTFVKRRDGAVDANHQKSEMKDWLASVVGELVVAAPDLRGMTLEEAIERGQHEGLRLMIFGDGVQITGVPAGLIVSQSPLPGSRALRGGDITVVLSRM